MISASKEMEAIITSAKCAAGAATLTSLHVEFRTNSYCNGDAGGSCKGSRTWTHGPPILKTETAGRSLTGRKQVSHDSCLLFNARNAIIRSIRVFIPHQYISIGESWQTSWHLRHQHGRRPPGSEASVSRPEVSSWKDSQPGGVMSSDTLKEVQGRPIAERYEEIGVQGVAQLPGTWKRQASTTLAGKFRIDSLDTIF